MAAFPDFYLNSIRTWTSSWRCLLAELDNLKLTDNTIVGVHQRPRRDGRCPRPARQVPFAYQEAIHLPLHIVHPDVAGGQSVSSLTGHIDLAPSLLSFAGVKAVTRARWQAGTCRARISVRH